MSGDDGKKPKRDDARGRTDRRVEAESNEWQRVRDLEVELFNTQESLRNLELQHRRIMREYGALKEHCKRHGLDYDTYHQISWSMSRHQRMEVPSAPPASVEVTNKNRLLEQKRNLIFIGRLKQECRRRQQEKTMLSATLEKMLMEAEDTLMPTSLLRMVVEHKERERRLQTRAEAEAHAISQMSSVGGYALDFSPVGDIPENAEDQLIALYMKKSSYSGVLGETRDWLWGLAKELKETSDASLASVWETILEDPGMQTTMKDGIYRTIRSTVAKTKVGLAEFNRLLNGAMRMVLEKEKEVRLLATAHAPPASSTGPTEAVASTQVITEDKSVQARLDRRVRTALGGVGGDEEEDPLESAQLAAFELHQVLYTTLRKLLSHRVKWTTVLQDPLQMAVAQGGESGASFQPAEEIFRQHLPFILGEDTRYMRDFQAFCLSKHFLPAVTREEVASTPRRSLSRRKSIRDSPAKSGVRKRHTPALKLALHKTKDVHGDSGQKTGRRTGRAPLKSARKKGGLEPPLLSSRRESVRPHSGGHAGDVSPASCGTSDSSTDSSYSSGDAMSPGNLTARRNRRGTDASRSSRSNGEEGESSPGPHGPRRVGSGSPVRAASPPTGRRQTSAERKEGLSSRGGREGSASRKESALGNEDRTARKESFRAGDQREKKAGLDRRHTGVRGDEERGPGSRSRHDSLALPRLDSANLADVANDPRVLKRVKTTARPSLSIDTTPESPSADPFSPQTPGTGRRRRPSLTAALMAVRFTNAVARGEAKPHVLGLGGVIDVSGGNWRSSLRTYRGPPMNTGRRTMGPESPPPGGGTGTPRTPVLNQPRGSFRTTSFKRSATTESDDLGPSEGAGSDADDFSDATSTPATPTGGALPAVQPPVVTRKPKKGSRAGIRTALLATLAASAPKRRAPVEERTVNRRDPDGRVWAGALRDDSPAPPPSKPPLRGDTSKALPAVEPGPGDAATSVSTPKAGLPPRQGSSSGSSLNLKALQRPEVRSSLGPLQKKTAPVKSLPVKRTNIILAAASGQDAADMWEEPPMSVFSLGRKR